MIYSEDINKVCALCEHSETIDGNEDILLCNINKKNTAITDSCAKFKYDIFKKPVRRKRRLKTDFDPEDFVL